MQITDIKARQRAQLDALVAERRAVFGDSAVPSRPRRRRTPPPPAPPTSWSRATLPVRPGPDEDDTFGAFAWFLVQLTGLLLAGLALLGALGWRLGWWLS